MRILLTAAVMVAASTSASLAVSVTTTLGGVSVTRTGPTLGDAQAAEAAFLNNKVVVATETFEGFTDGSRSVTYNNTGVGTFTDNDPGTFDGQGLGILSAATAPGIPFSGRFNLTPSGSLWLDSFDSQDVSLALNLPSNATGLGFYMTDLDDQGADTQMSVLGAAGSLLGSFDLTPANPGDGSYFYVAISFMGTDVTGLQFTHNDSADGWGVDDFSAVAPVPLPAAGWMLIAGLGALFGFGRRKAAA
jgi:hypothetical protein